MLLAPLHALAEVARHEAADGGLAKRREDLLAVVRGVDRQGDAGVCAQRRGIGTWSAWSRYVGEHLAELAAEGLLGARRVAKPCVVAGEALQPSARAEKKSMRA